jgi:hypothetical protein
MRTRRGISQTCSKAWTGQQTPSTNKTNLSKGKIVTPITSKKIKKFKQGIKKNYLSTWTTSRGRWRRRRKSSEGSNRTKTVTNQEREAAAAAAAAARRGEKPARDHRRGRNLQEK